ncbi:hypothetical protein Acr_24g0007560 [Actinidia rufa]|uniref:Uncharacterized protein n=1 Tax=Actinidia rufa TaxID=165716 RepID=A0A7J0GUV6_9ERIC|nr:hypothetical protein Acr_24g0007560 [Actinidia rufa]
MNSEDAMHDANANANANANDFYSGETAGDSDDANDADYHCIGHDSDDSDHIIFYRHQYGKFDWIGLLLFGTEMTAAY